MHLLETVVFLPATYNIAVIARGDKLYVPFNDRIKLNRRLGLMVTPILFQLTENLIESTDLLFEYEQINS